MDPILVVSKLSFLLHFSFLIVFVYRQGAQGIKRDSERRGEEEAGVKNVLRPIRYRVIIDDPYSEEERFKSAPKRSKNIRPSTDTSGDEKVSAEEKIANAEEKIFKFPDRTGRAPPSASGKVEFTSRQNDFPDSYGKLNSNKKLVERLFDDDEEDESAAFVRRTGRTRLPKRKKAFTSPRFVKRKFDHRLPKRKFEGVYGPRKLFAKEGSVLLRRPGGKKSKSISSESTKPQRDFDYGG